MALKSYKKAIKIDSSNEMYYRNAARQLFSANMLKEAKKYIDKALDLNPKNIYSLNILTILKVELGSSDAADVLFREIIEMYPQEAITYYNLGNYYLNQSDTLGAIKSYKDAIERDSLYLMAYNILANILGQTGNINESLKYYELGSCILPRTNSDIFYNYGNILQKLQEHAEAIKKYRSAIQIQPNDIDSYISWGVSLRVLGKPDEAIKKYIIAVGIDSTKARAYYNWGNVLGELGQYNESMQKYRMFLRYSKGEYPKKELRIRALIYEYENN